MNTPRTDVLHAEQGISPRKVFAFARTLERELSAKTAECERLAKDAERYRWLFGHDLGDIGHRYQQVWRAWDGDGGCAGFTRFLDAAIAASPPIAQAGTAS